MWAVAVLAGGRSRRMGQDKALLPLNGVPLLQRVLDAARPLGWPIHLIANQPSAYAPFNLPTHPDLKADRGPLGGLYTAFQCTQADAVLLLACDLPFLTPDFLRYLTVQLKSHSAVAPTDANGPHPLCAAYRRTVLPVLSQALDSTQLSMRHFLRRINAHLLPPTQWSSYDPHNCLLSNLNTPKDFTQASTHLPPT